MGQSVKASLCLYYSQAWCCLWGGGCYGGGGGVGVTFESWSICRSVCVNDFFSLQPSNSKTSLLCMCWSSSTEDVFIKKGNLDSTNVSLISSWRSMSVFICRNKADIWNYWNFTQIGKFIHQFISLQRKVLGGIGNLYMSLRKFNDYISQMDTLKWFAFIIYVFYSLYSIYHTS